MTATAYLVEGCDVTPTEHSRGPWFDDQQHGASLLGLLTRCMEQVPSFQNMRFTRVTADLSRPVPIAPCVVEARPLRDGKRLQSLEAVLRRGDEIMARAIGTRIRFEPGIVPASTPHPDLPGDTAPPRSTRISDFAMNFPSFHDCIEACSDDDVHDGAPTWYRLTGELVAGEVPSPSVRVASIADLVVSSAPYLPPGWVSINPEVSFQLERLPVGDWIGVESVIRFTGDGIGVSEAVLYDETSRIGRTSKSTLNFPR